jgi:hypothetical protein
MLSTARARRARKPRAVDSQNGGEAEGAIKASPASDPRAR